MKYLICLSVIIAVWVFLRIQRHLKCALIRKILWHQYAVCQHIGYLSIFAGDIFELVSLAVMQAPYHLQKEILYGLKKNDVNTLLFYLKQYEPPLCYALNVLLERQTRFVMHKIPRSVFSKLALCLICECQTEHEKIESILKELPVCLLNRKLKFLIKICSARCLFWKTDLNKCSKILSKLLRNLTKKDEADKAAYLYFMLGETYRIAGLYDTAHLMYYHALTIFSKTNQVFGQGVVKCALGLSCILQGCFTEADKYFEDVRRFCYKQHNDFIEARLLNLQALSYCLQHLPDKAYKTAHKAFNKNEAIHNLSGMAFSTELKAVSAYHQEKLTTAHKLADKAVRYFRQARQFYGETEAKYVVACICSALGQKQKADKIFKCLKSRKKIHKAFFYIASIEKLMYGSDVGKT